LVSRRRAAAGLLADTRSLITTVMNSTMFASSVHDNHPRCS
jgi:hypothetical protein